MFCSGCGQTLMAGQPICPNCGRPATAPLPSVPGFPFQLQEYAGKVGWGHSSYAHAAQAAESAGVRRLLLFHHDPEHTDAFLDGMLADARKLFPGTGMATEGAFLDVGKLA